jgi:hypothetical protein
MKNIFIFLILLFSHVSLIAQIEKRSFNAEKVSDNIVIDGLLNENVWQGEPMIKDFYQYVPNNAEEPSSETNAWFYYGDNGIYVGITCLEDDIDDLQTELRARDEHFGSNSDGVGVMLSPYNDGINYNYFLVSASNVQTDEMYSAEGSDASWSAVWESEVSVNDKGWNCEIFIPYSALRFSKKEIQTWGVNIWRFSAKTQEWSSWNYVNNENINWWKYTGDAKDLKNLNPPVRLSVTPYISGSFEKETGNKPNYDYNLGMDLKYGISESITLDMTLIPDFKQVQSDDVVLNLSPFEQYYNEKRQFFTEGMDLFKKGDIFYSRRIGQKPQKYDLFLDSLNENDEIINNPQKNQLINSTKISGRTKSGLGFGILNSMTSESIAEYQDSGSSEINKYSTQPFTNYNVAVIDQTLFNNSYLSLINTNYYNSDYKSNVTATEFYFGDTENIYGLKGIAAYSYVKDEGINEGYKAFLNGGKTGGKFRSIYNLSIISENYNQNYLGYMRNNNQWNNQLDIQYKILKPFSVFLSLSNEFRVNYNMLYNPNVYSELTTSYVIRASFKNQYNFIMHAMWAPKEKHDYYETRSTEKYISLGKWYHNCFTLDTDPTKIISSSFHYGFNNSYGYFINTKSYRYRIEPSFKINNKLRINYGFRYDAEKNTPGFVDSDETSIYMGERDRETITNSIDFSYVFTNEMSVKLRLRHYWAQAEYDNFYTVEDEGELLLSSYAENNNVNYNAFNIDMTYSWNFAPGSELLVNWKYSTNLSDDNIQGDYWNNLSNVMDYSNINSLSIKFIYFIDYFTVKSKFI